MRILSYICKTLMWVFCVIYLLFQGLTIYSLTYYNDKAISLKQPDHVYNPVALIVATALMLLAVILFVAMKKRRYIGIIMATVSALVILVVALDLGREFPAVIGTGGMDTGLNAWKLIWRHIGISVVPIFMLGGWLAERAADKEDKALFGDKKGYDLSGAILFKDDDDEDRDPFLQIKPKRSVRKRMEKDNNSIENENR